MKGALAFTVLLAVATAYYFYIPLPSTISEPWKLMLLDGVLRSTVHVGQFANSLGICHFLRVLNITFTLGLVEATETLLVSDTTMGGVEACIYEWKGGEVDELKRGVVFFHGGGWILGSAKKGTYDMLCRKMATDLKAIVVSVDYRLGPVAHFPDQFEDAFHAAKHFLQPEVLARYSVDPGRVGVSGDSAGGNLAAAVAQQVAIDSSISVKFKVQSLIYPVLQALDFNTPSYLQNQKVPILYRPLMVTLWLEYLNADPSLYQAAMVNNHSALDLKQIDPFRATVDWTVLLPPQFRKGYKPVAQARGTSRMVEEVSGLLDVRAAPLLAEREVLAQTPRAYVLTCEHDVLRDDGLMYARRLEEAGVTVTSDYYEDGFHGCLSLAFWPTFFSVGNRTLTNYIAWLHQNL